MIPVSIDSNALTTWLYFFSSVFQGNAALLAVVGAFLVFVLQDRGASISGTLNDLDQQIIAYVRTFMVDPYKQLIPIPIASVYKLRGVLERIGQGSMKSHRYAADKAKELLKDSEFDSLMSDRAVVAGQFKETTLRAAYIPSLLTGILIIGSLIAIWNPPSSISWHKWIYLATAALNCISLLSIGYFVKRVLSKPLRRETPN